MMQGLGKVLMITGAVLFTVGVLGYFGGRIGLGRLPGDIVYRKGNFTFYFPLTTGILISIVLTVIFNLFRLRK